MTAREPSRKRAMANPQPKQKIYCYVDETGQDTEGDLFLVALVVTGQERDVLA